MRTSLFNPLQARWTMLMSLSALILLVRLSGAQCGEFAIPPNSTAYFGNSWIVILNMTGSEETIENVFVDLRETIGTVDSSLDASDYMRKWELDNGIVILMWKCKSDAMKTVWDVRTDHARLRHVTCIEAAPKLVTSAPEYLDTPEGLLQREVYWHLDRVDQKGQPYDGAYTFSNESKGGEGVNVFIVDTGIRADLEEFGGRASLAFSSVVGETEEDCNGHGTHVAGIVGSATYGFAKNTRLLAIKALDCDGASTSTSVLDGLYWIWLNGKTPGIVSMSLGGDAPPRSLFLNGERTDALGVLTDALMSRGFSVIIAAGNENRDACSVTPAYKGETTAAITVGASTIDDERASFSNYGPCVNIFAPGVSIMSTWIDGASIRLKGTSMAAPAVTGIAALHLASQPTLSPMRLKQRLLEDAARGQMVNLRSDTSNLLLHSRYSFKPPSSYMVPIDWLEERKDVVIAAASTISIAAAMLVLSCAVYLL